MFEDPSELLKLLLDAPLALLLLYLLISEQKAHTETRKARDADNREWSAKVISLTERVTSAIERLGDIAQQVQVQLRKIDMQN